MNNSGVRLQNLRDFTVQIHRLSDDAIVGTGISVLDGTNHQPFHRGEVLLPVSAGNTDDPSLTVREISICLQSRHTI